MRFVEGRDWFFAASVLGRRFAIGRKRSIDVSNWIYAWDLKSKRVYSGHSCHYAYVLPVLAVLVNFGTCICTCWYFDLWRLCGFTTIMNKKVCTFFSSLRKKYAVFFGFENVGIEWKLLVLHANFSAPLTYRFAVASSLIASCLILSLRILLVESKPEKLSSSCNLLIFCGICGSECPRNVFRNAPFDRS